ncbi:MAG: hypothetical protein ACOC33_03450 [bacterium]
MPAQDYDRYSILKNKDGSTDMMPFINIPDRSSDKFEYWNTEFSRMDKLSQKYYGNPFYDFLILYANPQYTSQWDIPDGSLIKIPFPLEQVRSDYEAELRRIKNQ